MACRVPVVSKRLILTTGLGVVADTGVEGSMLSSAGFGEETCSEGVSAVSCVLLGSGVVAIAFASGAAGLGLGRDMGFDD
jgi:hypothetical protein